MCFYGGTQWKNYLKKRREKEIQIFQFLDFCQNRTHLTRGGLFHCKSLCVYVKASQHHTLQQSSTNYELMMAREKNCE